MTFARETGGDLRAGGASVQLWQVCILPAEHAVRFLGRAAERDHENGTI
jgi:hypothetical protein